MMNLENLDSFLRINRDVGLVDGNELKKNIINHMQQLNKCTFNIYSRRYHPVQTNLLLNEETQHIFRYFPVSEIISCIDYFPEKQYSQCLIYSYPYKLKFYHHLSNHFPGGTFRYVIEVSLYDERPFSHEFFIRIAQSFPLLEELTVVNRKPQIDERYIETIIEYPHLKRLVLSEVHDDYVEQFLVDTKMCLSNAVSLSVLYGSLERVTHSFQREATRINCAKLRFLSTYGRSSLPQHVKDYFPHTSVSSN
jgi:hypothetical protein